MPVVEKLQLVGLVSGSASTLGEIYKATQDGRLPKTELAMVISSKPEAGSFKRFKNAGFNMAKFAIVRREDFEDPRAYGDTLLKAMRIIKPDIVGQYGHTPLTPEHVIADFIDNGTSMINQHPGPVDPSEYDFGGKGMSSAPRTHMARLLFVRETGRNPWTDVVAQRVSKIFDGGKVLKRGRVEILPTDNVESLQERAIVVERAVQIDTLHDFEENTVEEQPTYSEMGIELVREEEHELLKLVKRVATLLNPTEA